MERKDNQHYFSEYLKDCARKQTPGSLDTTTSCIKVFGWFLEDSGIHILDVDKTVMREFLDYLRDERKVVTSTQKTTFSAVSGLFKFLIYEDVATKNPALCVRDRYLKGYKNGENSDAQQFHVVSNEEMATIINMTLNPRDRAVLALLAKTGIRRAEMIAIDMDDIDWKRQCIRLKPKRKRSNRLVYFDDECARALQDYLEVREKPAEGNPLFVNQRGGRLGRNAIECIVNRAGARVGLHDPETKDKGKRLSPHCFRHWFTTALLATDIKEAHVQELRGDKRGRAMDIYNHINPDDVRRSYLTFMPKLGI